MFLKLNTKLNCFLLSTFKTTQNRVQHVEHPPCYLTYWARTTILLLFMLCMPSSTTYGCVFRGYPFWAHKENQIETILGRPKDKKTLNQAGGASARFTSTSGKLPSPQLTSPFSELDSCSLLIVASVILPPEVGTAERSQLLGLGRGKRKATGLLSGP